MGRRYAVDISLLPRTVRWSLNLGIEDLVHAISLASTSNLIAIGSGGSYTVANFAASLHQRYTGKLSKPVTPLEYVSDASAVSEAAILVFSATGRNPDILGAFKKAIESEPKQLIVVCFQPGSPLVQLASPYRYVDTFAVQLPSGKDGFLATNSLLATAILLYRAYDASFCRGTTFPKNYNDLLGIKRKSSKELFSSLRTRCAPLWERETIIVLHGPSTQPAAVDFESKFVEAALGNVQVTDYRNFAHGRHHWLAKHPLKSGIVAFISDDDRELAERTLALIPEDVLAIRLDLAQRAERASLAALLYVLQLVGFAGSARGIDPGTPGVPYFGRRIFRMTCLPKAAKPKPALVATSSWAVARKRRAYNLSPNDTSDLKSWECQYMEFCKNLAGQVFGALVIDYDGTLCDERDRYCGIDKPILNEITRILRSGIPIAIATGRGKSVREDLRRKLVRRQWNKVIIGYYNGADRASLADNNHPNSSSEVIDSLLPMRKIIESDTTLSEIAQYTYRRAQITVEPKHPSFIPTIWLAIQQYVQRIPSVWLSVLRSKHSIDVLAPGVSKTLLFNDLEHLLASNRPKALLCIGDLGRWPGNDHELLGHPFSLSVDEVSQDPKTCWNLAPPGHRGSQATLDYLRAIRILAGSFSIDVESIGKAKP